MSKAAAKDSVSFAEVAEAWKQQHWVSAIHVVPMTSLLLRFLTGPGETGDIINDLLRMLLTTVRGWQAASERDGIPAGERARLDGSYTLRRDDIIAFARRVEVVIELRRREQLHE